MYFIVHLHHEVIDQGICILETEQLPGDSCTDDLLTAVCENPSLLILRIDSLIDRLKELLQKGYSAKVVGAVCRRVLENVGPRIGDIQTSFFGASRELIDISITLQRFAETREDATWLFEQLLAWNAYSVAETKAILDQRMA